MTDKPNSVIAEHLLTGEGWKQNVQLSWDDTGRITALQADASSQSSSQPSVPLYRCVVPGMPNVHSHAFQRAMAGLTERRSSVAASQGKDSSPEPASSGSAAAREVKARLSEPASSGSAAARGANHNDNFWSWRSLMYAFVQHISPEQLQVIARQLYIDMLKSGYTSVGEFHYVHHQPDGTPYMDAATISTHVMEAAAEAGIALTHLPVLYMHSDFGGKAPTEGQRRFVHSVDSYLKLVSRLNENKTAQTGIAFHSLRAVSPDALHEVMDALPSMGLQHAPIHIHIAEQQKEVADCEAWSGQRPVAWLLDQCNVDARWCLVHATHLTNDEVRELAYSGAVAGLCPTTEANLGDGIFPAVDYMTEHKGNIGIGSDSHISVNPWEELRMLEYSQRLMHRKRALLTDDQRSVGRALYDHAVQGGAQVLGLGSGALEVGGRADFISLSTDNPLFTGRQGDALLDTAIFASGAAPVQDVYVGGQRVVTDGHHALEEPSAKAFKTVMAALLDR